MNTATSQFDGHSPGPWKVEDGHGRDFARIIVASSTPNGAYVVASADPYCPDHKAQDANARLIAAAPELLRQRDELAKSCRALLDVLYENPTHGLCTGPRAEWEIECVRSALASIENGA